MRCVRRISFSVVIMPIVYFLVYLDARKRLLTKNKNRIKIIMWKFGKATQYEKFKM